MTERRSRNALVALVLTALAISLSPNAARSQDAPVDNCLSCHRALGDARLSAPAQAYDQDVHAAKGFTCAACHGGDATAAGFEGMDPAKGFVATPLRRRIPDFCGRCHSDAPFMRQYNPSLRVDQVTEYSTSVHGRRLAQLADTLVAVCTSCHPAHAIRPPADPQSSVYPLRVADTCGACHADSDYMAPYPIPTDQLDKYRRSIHWEMMSVEGDLSAPTCNDCHGNHGAAPPGISWVGNVCGQCHSVMAENFSQSRHAETFAMLGVPGCATCHQNHEVVRATDAMLGLEDGAVCARCHSAGDAGGEAAATMRAQIDSLNRAFAAADSILLRAERAGMEVSQALVDLGGANNSGIQARAAMHAFDVAAMTEKIDEGLGVTAQAYRRGQQALGELQFRRTGLAVSVTIILMLIVGLLLRIRLIERQEPTA